jgi:hypothetical protein
MLRNLGGAGVLREADITAQAQCALSFAKGESLKRDGISNSEQEISNFEGKALGAIVAVRRAVFIEPRRRKGRQGSRRARERISNFGFGIADCLGE